MAKFKRGISGNPNGRPKLDAQTKRIRTLTNEQLKDMGDEILLGTRKKLQGMLEDPECTPLKCWIANVALKGIQSGDMGSLNELLNRLIGKVKDTVDVNGIALTIIERLDGSETVLGAKKIEEEK